MPCERERGGGSRRRAFAMLWGWNVTFITHDPSLSEPLSLTDSGGLRLFGGQGQKNKKGTCRMTWGHWTLPLFFAILEGISVCFPQLLGHQGTSQQHPNPCPLKVHFIGQCIKFLPLEGHPFRHTVLLNFLFPEGTLSFIEGHSICFYCVKDSQLGTFSLFHYSRPSTLVCFIRP